MQNDEELDAIFIPNSDGVTESNERIKKIVTAARRETNIRDLLTHAILNIWKPLLSMGAIVLTFFNHQHISKHKKPGD